MFIKYIIISCLSALIGIAPAGAQSTLPISKSAQITQLAGCFPTQFTGAITPTEQVECLTSIVNSYQQFASYNPQAGTTYTFVGDTSASSDNGKFVTFNNANPVAASLPAASSSGFYPWNVYIKNLGVGVVTIRPTTSTINGASTLALVQGQQAWIISDGTNYQVFIGTPGNVIGPATSLIGNYACWANSGGSLLEDCGGGIQDNFYVDASTGNDANDCLAATSSGGHAPCLTLQRAVDVLYSYSAGVGESQTINVAAGAYTGLVNIIGAIRGSGGGSGGDIYIIGAGASSTTINGVSGFCGTIIASNYASVVLEHMTVTGNATGCQNSLYAQLGASITVVGPDFTFGAASNAQAHTEDTGSLIQIVNGVNITGNAAIFLQAIDGALAAYSGAITVATTITYSTAFAATAVGGIDYLSSVSLSGTGAINGPRYVATTASLINTDSTSLTYLPGNSAGSASGGSHYFGPPDNAWAPYTPTLACQSGTLTTASAAGRYKTSNNTTNVSIVITLTTVGSCSVLSATLPNTSNSVAVLSGYNGQDGKMVYGVIGTNATTISLIANADNTSVLNNSTVLDLSGSYENQ